MKIFQIPLFEAMSEAELADMQALHCMRTKVFEKNAVILHSGDRVRNLGIVLNGSVLIENVNVWGDKSILSRVEPGQVFAESYALCGEPLLVDAVAAERAEILFLHLDIVLSPEYSGRPWHARLMQRLTLMTARKNLVLSRRIFCTSPRSVRERLLTYLSGQTLQCGSAEFDIPFNRQQMADYLNLDRSALSKELGRMRDEGLLSFRKNHFRLFIDLTGRS